MPFHVGGRRDRGGIQELVNYMDGPAFLKREWWDWVLVGQSSQLCKWNGAHLHV